METVVFRFAIPLRIQSFLGLTSLYGIIHQFIIYYLIYEYELLRLSLNNSSRKEIILLDTTNNNVQGCEMLLQFLTGINGIFCI